MLWLNTADPDTIAIVRATVVTEENRNPPSNQTERFFEIATSPQEVRRAG